MVKLALLVFTGNTAFEVLKRGLHAFKTNGVPDLLHIKTKKIQLIPHCEINWTM
jgi:hypothetical protein